MIGKLAVFVSMLFFSYAAEANEITLPDYLNDGAKIVFTAVCDAGTTVATTYDHPSRIYGESQLEDYGVIEIRVASGNIYYVLFAYTHDGYSDVHYFEQTEDGGTVKHHVRPRLEYVPQAMSDEWLLRTLRREAPNYRDYYIRMPNDCKISRF